MSPAEVLRAAGAYPLPDEEDVTLILESLRKEVAEIARMKAVEAWVNLDGDDPSDCGAFIDKAVAAKVSVVIRRGTRESWGSIRKRIFERYRGVCHVCAQTVDREYYECGHIIDRCRGGMDRDSNLVVMCIVCNRLKPPHESRAAYVAWLESGPIGALARELIGMMARP